MIDAKLKQIDRQIVELLGQRISLLANASNPPSVAAQIANLAPLLTLFNVPQEIGEQLVTNCSIKHPPARVKTPEKSRRITIVGGKGRMGQFFAQQLALAGHCVETIGRKDWEKAPELIATAELVLISVPIEQTLTIIERTAKYLAPDAAIADITSIKTEPVAKMLACHQGAVMGLHPMFGPNQNSFAAQKIVVCSGRHDASFKWFLDFMASQGGDLIYCSPPEHDRLMAIIQAVRHFSQLGFGVFLNSEPVDLERSLAMASPNYRLEYEAVQRFFGQNPTMYIDIMLATETSRQTIARLAEIYQYLADLVAQKDREALIGAFVANQDLLESLSYTSLAKSDRQQEKYCANGKN
ncbi:MAG TPA: bifunctional chorismate mutase/prephenate dehydrogenase [Xenococcaceae cyanobacterium]